MAAITLAKVATINNKNLSGVVYDNLLEAAPVAMSLAAQVSSNGATHSYLRYTTAPTVGFRAENDGRVQSSSDDTQVDVTLKILDASYTVDVAHARIYKGGEQALLAREGVRHLRTAFANLEKQIFYGAVGADAAGFVGLLDNTFYDAIADGMVISAGGSTASAQTSVWLLRNGEEDISLVTGNNGEIKIEESRVQSVPGSTGPYPAWYTPVTAWYGLQVGGQYSAARICNVETSLTDDLIGQAISLFPADRQPNMIVMNRKSLRLLRESRTATSPSGAPAAFPDSVFGIPVVVTDQITSTEAVEV